VPTRYFPEASSVNFRRSVMYGIKTLNVVLRFLLHRFHVRSFEQFELISGGHLEGPSPMADAWKR